MNDLINDVIVLGKLYKKDARMLPATLLGLGVGGLLGVIGFYGGWLG